MLVGRRMTKNPKTVGPDDPLTRAADIMRTSRINHLPVVEEGKLVGILGGKGPDLGLHHLPHLPVLGLRFPRTGGTIARKGYVS